MFSLGPAAHYQPWDYRLTDPLHTLDWFVESLAWHVLDLVRRTQTRAQTFLGIRSRFNYLYAITLDDSMIFTVPGELSEELAHRVRGDLDSGFEHVIFSTMTNGYEGYLLSGAEELERVTYEAKMDSPKPGETMMDDLLRLLKPEYPGREEQEWVGEMGQIAGRIAYDLEGSTAIVGVMNHAERPIEDWRFNGKSVDATSGFYELTYMAPGVKYLYVLELVPKGDAMERRVLSYGRAVFVKPNEHVAVDFDFSRAVWKTEVRELVLDEESIRAGKGAITGKIEVSGKAREGEITGVAYPWTGLMILDTGRNSLPEPLRRFAVPSTGEFKPDSLPQGMYGIVFMVDLNGNNRPEPSVDVVSTVSRAIVVR